ncbi:MAG: glycosyltransferase [Balneolaceae bacterium]|nr:MAG: glycosyltransferase [Balneolaceae bacterium]
MLQSIQILIIGTVWPEPNSSAAGGRMMQLIQLFRQREWDVIFASSAAESEHSADLEKLGVVCRSIEMNSSSFDRFISGLMPDAVMFDRFMTEEQFGWRVAEQCPNAMRILDTEDLHCLRQAREKAWKEGREFQSEDLLTEEIARREIASIWRCDLSLIISEFEYGLLQSLFKVNESLLHYLPFLNEPADETVTRNWPPFEARSGFVSIGNFLHRPNWNAVLWLKEEIWPMIRQKLPDAELHIYGAYPSQKVFQLHNKGEKFLVKGRAEDAGDVLRKARVLLAPIRFGAGLKGKLVDAMMNGTPSVTTDIGAEGIYEEQNWCGSVENDPEDFFRSAVQLYKDQKLWEKAQIQGARILNDRFLMENFADEFIQKIVTVKGELHSHRKRNFIGSMLMHHTAASTRYMSKWIEAKNSANIDVQDIETKE